MIDAEAVLEAFSETCPGETFEADTIPVAETVISVPAPCIEKVIAELSSTFSVCHLSTITGQDRGTILELLYHFWHGQGITLRVMLPRDDARVPTLTGVIPGADFYERELGEMLGVTFEGHPGPEHLLLPEDWEGGPPLREESRAGEEES